MAAFACYRRNQGRSAKTASGLPSLLTMSTGTPPSHTAPATRTWKLVLAYDGTDFRGWQVQPGELTIQGKLADAVYRITGERVLPQGSGRTDAGVHAEGQAVSLELAAAIPGDRLLRALNRRLPAAIRVLSADPVDRLFHARAGVLSKTYEYRIFQRRTFATADERPCPPWQTRFVWDCRWPVALAPMQKAAEFVVGTHDYTSFAAHDPERSRRVAEMEGGGTAPSNVRSIFSSTWQENGGILSYRVSGSGFLHHMVRNLVGTFVEVGAGRRDADSLPGILAARDRRLAGMTAPPQGLCLMEVRYGSDPCQADGSTNDGTKIVASTVASATASASVPAEVTG